MKYKLSVLERVKLAEMLPGSGNFITMRLMEDFKHKVGFDAKEQEELKMTATNNRIEWKKGIEREFEIEPIELVLIQDNLRKWDEEKKLTSEHISLYEKFMEVK